MLLSDKYPFLTNFFENAIGKSSGEQSKLAQSIVLYGNDLDAQYTLALEIARLLNCIGDKSDDCQCLNCKWVREGTHPAVQTITRFNAPLTIPLKESQIPLNISLTPFQAFFQSPVKTPVMKSIIPLRTSIIPPMTSQITPIPVLTISTTVFTIGTILGTIVLIIQFINGTSTLFQISFSASITFPTKFNILSTIGEICFSTNSVNLSPIHFRRGTMYWL